MTNDGEDSAAAVDLPEVLDAIRVAAIYELGARADALVGSTEGREFELRPAEYQQCLELMDAARALLAHASSWSESPSTGEIRLALAIHERALTAALEGALGDAEDYVEKIRRFPKMEAETLARLCRRAAVLRQLSVIARTPRRRRELESLATRARAIERLSEAVAADLRQ